MIVRSLPWFLLLLMLTGMTWARKPKTAPLTADALITRSDAAYYFPQAHGVTDLAVDVTVEQLANDAVIGKIPITFCFAGTRREFVIKETPGASEKARQALMMLVAPLGEYVVPKTSKESFTGMRVAMQKVARQLMGQPGDSYYQLVGTPEDDKSPLKEYRVLLDERGLAHQVESESRDGGVMIARLQNVEINGRWGISQICTRLGGDAGPQWEITTVTYTDVDGASLPATITIQRRNTFNQPIKNLPDFTFAFANYRINQGAAAAMLPPVP